MKKIILRLTAIVLTLTMVVNPFVPVVHALDEQVQQEELKEVNETNEEEVKLELEEEIPEEDEVKEEVKLGPEEEILEENTNTSLDEENNNQDETTTDLTKEDFVLFTNEIYETISDIESNKNIIDSYIENEVLLGNSPVVIIDDKDISLYLENSINELNNIISNVVVDNFYESKELFNTIKTNTYNLIVKFNDENKSLEDSGLLEDIDLLIEGYNELDGIRKDYFLNNNYDSYLDINKLDASLISYYTKLFNLDDFYQKYLSKKAEYLIRRPSDRALLDEKESFKSLYEVYSKEQAEIEIDSLLGYSFTSEEGVKNCDQLLELNLKEELRNKILSLRNEFYKIDFKDNSYGIVIRDNKIVINELLTKDEIISYIISNARVEIDDDLNLVLYDYKNEVLNEFKIVVFNDFNQDGVIDELDKELLAKEILKEDSDLFYDLNKDGVVSYDDFLEYSNEEDKDVKLSWYSYEEDGKMYYNLRMDNEVLSSFYFELSVNDNLEFDRIDGCDKYLTSSNGNKILGYNNISDEIVLVYNILDLKDEKSFSVKTLGNKIVDIYHYVIPEVVVEKQEPIVNEENNVMVDYDHTYESSYEVSANATDNENSEDKDKVNKENDDKEVQEKPVSEEKEEERKITTGNIIKIIIVVLLGAGIIYFLNKKELEKNEGTILEEDSKKDKK